MDELAHKVRNKRTHLGYRNLRSIYINEVMYADHLVLIANTKEVLENKITAWHEILEEHNLKLNV